MRKNSDRSFNRQSSQEVKLKGECRAKNYGKNAAGSNNERVRRSDALFLY